jgi:hypothetical protein
MGLGWVWLPEPLGVFFSIETGEVVLRAEGECCDGERGLFGVRGRGDSGDEERGT